MSDEDIDKTLNEILGAMTAATDQAAEATKSVARMIAVFYKELVEQGFDRQEALLLANTQLQCVMALASAADEDE